METVTIIVVVTVFIIAILSIKEQFKVFAANNNKVDESQGITKDETEQIISSFKNVYNTTFSTYDTELYNKIPFFETQTSFFTNAIHHFIETDINNRLAWIIKERKNNTEEDIYRVTEITDIYTLKQNETMYIICNATIINRKVFTARRFQYKLQISNLSKYFTKSNILITDILGISVAQRDIAMIAVRLNDTFNIESKVAPVNKTNDLFYIKNNLYLLSPFFTSDRDISNGLVTVTKEDLTKDRANAFKSG